MVESRGGRRYAIFFFVAAFVLLIAGRWVKPVDRVFLTVTAPFAAVITGAANGVGDAISGIMNSGQLRAENAQLKHRDALLIRRIALMQQELHDYALLKNMMKFQDGNFHLEFLPALVIGADPTGLGSTVVIDKGSQDGLRQGMTVLDQNGYFVGSLSNVFPTEAEVLLMLSPSSSVAAVDTKTQASGLVEGQYAGAPHLNDVVTGDRLHVNDLVVTSGQANLYPRNLLIGQVMSVKRSPQNVFQTAEIRPAADFGHLEVLQVIRNWRPSYPAQLVPQH